MIRSFHFAKLNSTMKTREVEPFIDAWALPLRSTTCVVITAAGRAPYLGAIVGAKQSTREERGKSHEPEKHFKLDR
jgi:hypothetical protein